MENDINPLLSDILSITKSKRKKKEMAQFDYVDDGKLAITVKDFRELLSNYDDNAVIRIEGGSDSGWEFVRVMIDNHEIASAE